jgi:hypothetical protein
VGNETDNDKYWSKNSIIRFAICVKKVPCAFAFKVCKENNTTKRLLYFYRSRDGVSKNAEFYADFKFGDEDFKNCPEKIVQTKTLKKVAQRSAQNLNSQWIRIRIQEGKNDPQK